MPISSFNTVLLFITYVNQKINNAVFSPIIQKFTEIQSFKSFKGFDIIWQFYLYTKNDSVLDSAFNVLINIFELCSKKEEDRNKSAMASANDTITKDTTEFNSLKPEAESLLIKLKSSFPNIRLK